MGIFGKKQKAKNAQKTRGLRMTEGLLPVFGPAQVGDSTTPIRPVSDEEAARSAELNATMERKTAPDGTVYLVEKHAE